MKKISSNGTDCDCQIQRIYQGYDDYEDDESEIDLSQVDKLFSGSGIRMMMKDEIFSVCIVDEKIVGVLVFNEDNYWSWGDEPVPVYYFSRVVSPECQGRGIAKKLLEDFMKWSRGAIVKSETWNRNLDNSLLNSGFIEEELFGDVKVKVHTFVPERFREDYFESKKDTDSCNDLYKKRAHRVQRLFSIYKSF